MRENPDMALSTTALPPQAADGLLDQTTIVVSAKAFQAIADWMDAPATPAGLAGMTRLMQAKKPWECG